MAKGRVSKVFTPSREQALWNCAVSCALNRRNRKCRERFGSHECFDCDLNIMHYGEFTPSDAKLFMMQAEGAAGDVRQAGNSFRNLLIAVAIIALALISLQAWTRYRTQQRFEQSIQMPRDTPPRASAVEHSEIMRTLETVKGHMLRGTDVNGDGLVDCIDAAVLFWHYYPARGRVRIVHNLHPDGRMNHLFNAVLIGTVWRTVEPQALHRNHVCYWMPSVWGDTYDPRFNVNATERWRRYAPR